jgi:hypothetical protein
MTDASSMASEFARTGRDETERLDLRRTLFALAASGFATSVSMIAMGLFATGAFE